MERFAARLIKLENRVNGLATGPQLAYSAIEDGSLEEYDGDGQLVTIIGKQPDGTHGAVVVSGPTPPRPSQAVVSGGPGLLNYGWDGNFAGDDGETDITIPAPMDFARVEAHASQVQGFTVDAAATLLDTLESPRGGSRTAMLEPGTWYVVLVSRALSGKRSPQSVEVAVEVLEPVGSDIDVEALKEEFRAVDEEMNAAIIQNQQDQAALAGTVAGLKDTTLPALDRDLALAKERLVSARTELDMLTGVAPLPDVYAQHIASATAAFQRVDIANLFVTGESALNTLTARRIAASVASFLQVSTDQLTAGTASFGTAVADKFFAEVVAGRKFYANQIVVGQPGNLMPDPGFNDAGMASLRNQHSTCTVAISSSNDLMLTNGGTGAQYLRPMGTAQSQAGVLANGWIAVKPGEVWSFTLQPSAFKGEGLMKFVGRTMDGSAYANPAATKTIPASSVTTEELSVEATIPANCYWIIPEVTVPVGGSSYIKRNTMAVTQVITPALIVDGLMNGKRIVGASIETNAATNRGVKLTDAGLFGFSSAGVETLRFDGTNSIITGAVYRTAAAGERVQLDATGMTAWNAANAQIFKISGGSVSMTGALTATGMTQPQTVPVLPAMAISMTMGPEVPVYVSGSPTSSKVPGVQWVAPAAGMLAPPQVYSASGRGLTLSGGVNGSNRSGGLDLYDGAASLYGSNGVSITSQVGAVTISAPSSGVDVLSRLRFPNPQGQVVWASATSQSGVQSGVVWGPGNLSMSSNLNAAGVISFPGNDTVLLSEAGVYSISALINTGAAGSWNTYATLKVGTADNGEPITAAGKAAGPWEFVLPSVTRWFNAGTSLRFRYGQSSGGTQSWSTVVNVVKHLG